MKGIIFTEFLDLVETRWGMGMAEDIIESCDLPSGGAYTTVGTYSHKEIAALAAELSRRTDMPLPKLLKVFGKHLFHALARAYPRFIHDDLSFLAFLQNVESYIHVEVLKLYPDAELPHFKSNLVNDHTLQMLYQSSRHLEDVCEGLIEGAAEHYHKKIHLSREDQADGVLFTIKLLE